jgi:hypothetical protein
MFTAAASACASCTGRLLSESEAQRHRYATSWSQKPALDEAIEVQWTGKNIRANMMV